MRSTANFRTVMPESQNMQTRDMLIARHILIQNGHSRSFKVIYFGVNEKSLRDYILQYTVSQKTMHTYFLLELCQISTNCENFWHKDSREDKLFGVVLIFHLT